MIRTLALLLAFSPALQDRPPGVSAQDEPEPLPNPRALAAAGKDDAAVAAWQAWIAREPKNPDHPLALVRFLRDNERLNDALDACGEAIRRIPKHYDLLYLMARLCQRKGEVLAATRGGAGTAAMYFEDVIHFAGLAKELAPNRREPRALLGMSQFGLGHHAAARREADELIRRFPDHPGGHILLGELLFAEYRKAKEQGGMPVKQRADLVARARKAFRLAIERDDKRVLPHRRLGDIGAWEGELDHALNRYAEALARDPARGAPIDWINENTTADRRAVMWDRAIRRFRELGTEPATAAADLHWHAGLVDAARTEWQEARDHMQRCFEIRPDYLNALFWYGLASFKLGREDDAVTAFATFALKSPANLAKAITSSGEHVQANVEIVSHIADLSFKRGNMAASRELNHAIALAEDKPVRWNNYAFLCRETRQYEASYAAYRRALEGAPEDPQLLNDCAVILQYHLLRDLDEAKRMYEEAIRLAKEHLRNTKLSRENKARFRQAIQDARGNLQLMKGGRKGRGGRK